MSDDFDWDTPFTRAVLDIEVFKIKHEKDIWVELEVSAVKWHWRRPRKYAVDMVRLFVCLAAKLSTCYHNHAAESN